MNTDQSMLRAHVIQAGEAQFDMQNEYVAGIPAICVAAASAALLAVRAQMERKQRLFEPNEGAFNALAQLLVEVDTALAALRQEEK